MTNRSLLTAVLAAVALYGAATRLLPNPRPFDAVWWRTHGPIDFGDERVAMARDLVAARKLVGKPRGEVLALLGEPTWRDAGSSTLWYELAEAHRGGNIDPTDIDELVVRFDDADRAIDARHEVWRDR